ncbi:unnamed protein product [Rhizophagus irregularis]|nr:unnamed protein product [Rhizophagus irregularis]
MSSSNNSNTVLSPIDLNVLPSEDMMRECLYEKNVDFALSYRIQKTLVTKDVILQEEAAQEVQEEAPQEVQEEVARQEEIRRTQEESPVLSLQQESPLEAPQNSQKKERRGRGRKRKI